MNIVSLSRSATVKSPRKVSGKIMLVKPPYFTPWTPPLGIAVLKSFLEQHDFQAKCFDFNIDPELWGMHHKYFAALQTLEDVSINDGYSKLWWILNAHMLARSNGADAATCERMLQTIIPLYGIRADRNVINTLIPLIERFYRRLEELTDQIDWASYSVVGTSTYTTSLGPSLFILRKVKQKYPHIITVIGGGVFADDLALGSDNLTTLIEEYPYVDHIVLGEGELLLLKLLEGEFSDKRVISLADLKGTTLEMKDVPTPDFSDLDSEIYYHLSIEGARSCPFQCSFCSETIQWGDYRKKPMDLFAGQVISLAEKYNNNAFFMGDSLMNPYINPFATELIDRKANIVYDGYLRADKPVANPRFVKLWADSGLFRVRLGIESAAARVLDSMDKMTTPKVISDVLKTLANGGIRTTTYWIVGFPGESEEDFQETCDFIREHHRFIYELEAHPYYYYPYGQIGSRLYQCDSLYPDEVTDVIKFKVWDVHDIQPSRMERYDRLRRISALAAELGLPNIYTMAERYQAEERWLGLHPLAVEVYEGTKISREKADPPKHKVEVFSKEWIRQSDDMEAILCYRSRIKNNLDASTLSKAVENLISYNEMLQVSLQDGSYVSSAEPGNELLHVYDCNDETEFDEVRRQSIEKISREMSPERGRSIRIVMIGGKDAGCEVLLLGHRAIVDSRSVLILFEDLFRIYLQLSNGKEVSLQPAQKTYLGFLRERQPGSGFDKQSQPESLGRAIQKENNIRYESGSVSLRLDKQLTSRIFSKSVKEFDFSGEEVIAAALLISLSKVNGQVEIDITKDYRNVDKSLGRAVGSLTSTYQLPGKIVSGSSSLDEIRQTLRMVALNSMGSEAAPTDSTAGRALLNLEYFLEEPWLGGDDWAPQGFVIEESGPRGEYLLEVVPVLSNGEIEVVLKYQRDTSVAKVADGIVSRLAAEVDAIVIACEHYISAKEFWLDEFTKHVPKSNVEITRGEHAGDDKGFASVLCEIDKAALDRVRAQSSADMSSVMLACYNVLLSRLSGRQRVTVVSFPEAGRLIPLKSNLSWNLKFDELASAIQQKASSAAKHQVSALDILTNELPKLDGNFAPPVFDAGYIFCESGAEREASDLQESLKPYSLDQELELVLKVVAQANDFKPEFQYRKDLFRRETIEKLSFYLASILEEVSKGQGVIIEEIALEKDDAAMDRIVDSDANEVFGF